MTLRLWPGPTAVLLLMACAADSATEPREIVLADLTGSWRVTSWEYSLAADPSRKVDWVVLQDLRGSLTVAGTGDFTVAPRLPGGFGQDHGQLMLVGDSLYWNGEDDEEWVHFDLTGGALTLRWPEEEYVDMDRNGEPESVRLQVRFRRE